MELKASQDYTVRPCLKQNKKATWPEKIKTKTLSCRFQACLGLAQDFRSLEAWGTVGYLPSNINTGTEDRVQQLFPPRLVLILDDVENSPFPELGCVEMSAVLKPCLSPGPFLPVSEGRE